MPSKIMTAKEAVEKYIKPGCHIAFGGFTILRRPMAIAYEVARQGIDNLFVSANGAGLCEEMLAGCGLIGKLESTLLGMARPMAVPYALCTSIEQGRIPLSEEMSNGTYAMSTLAGRLGLPFIPCIGAMGSDIMKIDSFGSAGLRGLDENGKALHPGIPPKKFEIIDDPFNGYGLRPLKDDTTGNKTNKYMYSIPENTNFTGKNGVKVAVVPPLMLDVAVVCAQRVSIGGVVRIEGLLAEDLDQTLCAKNIIIQCERVCSEDELRQNPEHNQIPPHFVSAIVEQPFGGFPGCVPNYYDYDPDFVYDYAAAVKGKSLDEVKEWWMKQIDYSDYWDYLTNTIGWDRLENLRADLKYHFKYDLKSFKGR